MKFISRISVTRRQDVILTHFNKFNDSETRSCVVTKFLKIEIKATNIQSRINIFPYDFMWWISRKPYITKQATETPQGFCPIGLYWLSLAHWTAVVSCQVTLESLLIHLKNLLSLSISYLRMSNSCLHEHLRN